MHGMSNPVCWETYISKICLLIRFVTDRCRYNGKTYASEATFPHQDGCNQCQCSSTLGVMCTSNICTTTTTTTSEIFAYLVTKLRGIDTHSREVTPANRFASLPTRIYSKRKEFAPFWEQILFF